MSQLVFGNASRTHFRSLDKIAPSNHGINQLGKLLSVLRAREVDRGVDETDVAERLRKIAELSSRAGIVFLGEQAEIITYRQQILEKRARVSEAPLLYVIIGEPEAAGEKRALSRRQAVDAAFGFVAHDQPALVHEPTFDRHQRAANLGMIGRQEADERNLQQARVEPPRAIELNEAAQLLVEALGADLGVDLIGVLAPSPGDFGAAVSRRHLPGAVERDPRHHLRMGEVSRAPAHFPNALVGLAPNQLQVLEDHAADILAVPR